MFKKLWRTMGVYKGQFISMIIMIAIGIGVFLGFNMEWATIEGNVNDFYNRTHFADYQVFSQQVIDQLENEDTKKIPIGFSKNDVEKIKNVKGIDNATRFVSIRTEVEQKDNDTMFVSVTENPEVSGFMLIDGQKYDPQSKDGIWLSDKYAQVNDVHIGDELTFVYQNYKVTGKVKGLVKSGEYLINISDKSQILPDYGSHGFAYISPQMYKDILGGIVFYPQINVISDLDKSTFTKEVDRAMTKTLMILSKEENISYAGPKGEIDEGKTMGAALPIIFLLIALLTMVTTMHRLVAKEKIQIGTLKALGFTDKKILQHYTSFGLFIAIIGSIIGIGFGFLIVKVIMDPNGSAMAVYLDMPTWDIKIPTFCYFGVLLVIAIMTATGYLSTKQMLKGTASEALQPYIPKRVKPMFIERFGFFHKLSFGTRWNLRDISRHKARTVMSLFGTLGCVMIMICCLGMVDTVDLMEEKYYQGAINYNSRVFIDDAEELIEEYDADASGSINVQIEEDAVSLDVYRLGKDKIRFLNTDMDFVNLSDDGAYICKRVAKDYDLDIGDTFEVSPYGSNKHYKLKVAGIMSSYAKSIAMTENYAKANHVDYKIDSIYTDVEKSQIPINDKITSVQTKESLVSAFDVMLETMNLMILLLVGSAVILGIIVLYNLGIMSYTERYREMATLKVVGFKDKQITKLLIQQNAVFTILGIILGIPVGIQVLKILVDTLAPEFELNAYISPLSYFISIAVTLGVSLIVSLLLARKNKKIDMVESLKSSE